MQLRCGIDPKALAALGVVLLVAIAFAAHHFWSARPQPVRAPAPAPIVAAPPRGQPDAPQDGARNTTGSAAVGGKRIVVDVAGKVRRPGIHRLPPGSRVTDALEAAGGVLRGADTQGLNRARLLADGEQIVVGAPGAGQAAGPGTGVGGTGGGAAPGGGAGAAAGPVSLNSATAEQLDTLPGVGPVLARHIIEFRTQRGGFTSVDQLRDVNGIGDRRFADLRPLVQP